MYEEQPDVVDKIIERSGVSGNDGNFTPHKENYSLNSNPKEKDKTPIIKEASIKYVKETEDKLDIEDSRLLTEDDIIQSIIEDGEETLDTLVRETITYLEKHNEMILVAKYKSIKPREEGIEVYYTFLRKGKLGLDEYGEIIGSSKTRVERMEIRDKPKSGGIAELVSIIPGYYNIEGDKSERLEKNEFRVGDQILKITEKEI